MPAAKALLAVVDDDHSVLRSLARLLRSVGYAVDTFASAADFLAALARSRPQCLVLDVQMPGMNGFELHGRLKELGHQIPVIYITAQDSPQNGITACQEGTIGLLIKPFNEEELLDLVAEATVSEAHPSPGNVTRI